MLMMPIEESARHGGVSLSAAPAAAAAPAWVGALEKYSEEELCSGELFVCGLDRRVRTSEDLRAIFAVYGPVKDARMIQQSGVKAGPRRQVSKGYGFVLFQDTRDNLKAVTALDGSRNAHGRRIKVMPAESSGTSAAVHEEERSLEDALAAAMVQEDYLDPQAVGGNAQALGAAGNALEGSVFEEEHLMLQSAEQGNMRVCMMQV
jgi:RNA recognition motif-containing protein